jgi:hypothetical protein
MIDRRSPTNHLFEALHSGRLSPGFLSSAAAAAELGEQAASFAQRAAGAHFTGEREFAQGFPLRRLID